MALYKGRRSGAANVSSTKGRKYRVRDGKRCIVSLWEWQDARTENLRWSRCECTE